MSITTDQTHPGRLAGILNGGVARLARLGIGLGGARLLSVPDRTSGQWRSTPVNALNYEGARYLVAPPGRTQWVRNLRAAGHGQLRLGRHVEPFTATELADDDKPAVLRAYLKRWKFEVGAFFDGVGPNSTNDELRRIAPAHPVFRITAE
jgi:deazaflavin-dependent oxidoreductase (nitroreductase family)